MALRQPFGRDLSSVKKFRDEMLGLEKRRVSLSDAFTDSELHVTLKSPTVTQYVNEGHRWISGIVDKITTSINTTANDEERNLIIQRYAQATSMRQYAHWIESIELDSNVIDDRETIEMTLDVMSADDRVREKFIEAVVKYINDSTLAVVGIPTYDCPVCHTEQKENTINDAFVNIIPLDVIQLFFGLITQRIQRIATR
jgi:hypothetical protein